LAERTHSVRLRLLVDNLRRDAADAAKSIGGIGSAAADTGKQSRGMEALGHAARNVGRTVAVIGTVAAGAMTALGVATIATGVSYNSLEQNTRAALTTLLGGAEAATAQMDELRQFVRTALFPREVFIEGQQQLLAFGLAAERVIPVLDAVQNAVAATGGSAQRFSEVVEILAEMQSTGEITAGTLNELGRRGINAAQLIGAAMGQTENEIRESITSGALDGRQAIDLLVTAMETRFAGAAALISNTWVGAVGLVTAALRDIGSAVVEPFIDPAGGGAAVVWAQNLAEVLYALERQVRDLVAVFRSSADPTLVRAGDLLLDLAEAIDRFDIDNVINRVRDGAPAFAALGAGIAAAGGAAVLTAIPGFGALAGAISPVGAAVSALVLTSPELRDVLLELLGALTPLVPVLLDTGVALATAVSGGASVLADVLRLVVPLVEAVVDSFTALPEPVQSAALTLGAFALALRFGGPVGVAIGALTALGYAMEAFGGSTDEVRSDVTGLAEDVEQLLRSGHVNAEMKRLFGDGTRGSKEFADALDDASGSFFRWDRLNRSMAEYEGNKQAFKDLDAAVTQLVKSGADADEVFQTLVDTYKLTEDQQRQLLELLPQFTTEAERHTEAVSDGTDGQLGFQGAVEDATGALREQADALRAQVDPVFALFDALRDVEAAQADFNAAVNDFGRNSPEAEQAARDLFEATVDLQGAAGDASGAFNGRLTPAMRDTLEAAGLTEGQIAAVEDILKDTKAALEDYEGRYEARVEVRGAAEAAAAARRVRDRLAEIDRTVTISFKTQGFAPTGSIRIPGAQHGGPIDFGPAGVDRVPAMLTRGEHVWTVREVEAAGGHQAVEALRAAVLGQASRFAAGGAVGVPRMASGGPVTGPAAGGWHVENVNVQAWSGRFSLRQIESELAMNGAV